MVAIIKYGNTSKVFEVKKLQVFSSCFMYEKKKTSALETESLKDVTEIYADGILIYKNK